MVFIDEARIEVRGGSGGDGCVAFRREKYVPKGGPAGGNGGNGGSVILVGDRSLNTLFHLRHTRHLNAERGRHGEGSNRTGRSGEDSRVRVPLGTLAYPADGQEPFGEILEQDEELVVAVGGRGGRGNAHFATATRQAPDQAQRGGEGAELDLRLELKLLADVGLVGLPNAGKSTFISVVSAARPKVADYPFTTLVPQLGVVALDPLRDPFVVADLPGLVEGAADGIGLGIQFLKHVERCRLLVHLVDLSGDDGDPLGDVTTVERELEAFNADLLSRQRFLVGSKRDAANPSRSESLREAASARGLRYYEVSAVTRDGLPQLLGALETALGSGCE